MKNRRGLIYNRVTYSRYKKQSKNQKGTSLGGLDDIPEEEEAGGVQNVEMDELEFMLFFKSCLVDRDFDVLKIRLKQSIGMRETLLKKKGTEFHKSFPFYFVRPELVSLSYSRKTIQRIMF